MALYIYTTEEKHVPQERHPKAHRSSAQPSRKSLAPKAKAEATATHAAWTSSNWRTSFKRAPTQHVSCDISGNPKAKVSMDPLTLESA